MKQLILMRHGEAQSQRPGLADFDRSLTDRGRTEALDAAECLRRSAVRIDALLASPAVRAKETALIVAAQLDFDQPLRYEQLLYGEEMQALLQALRHCEADAGVVLMVGHNPTVSALARHLAHDLPVNRETLVCTGDAEQSRLGPATPLELSTAGICRIQFDAASLRELGPQTVSTVTLMR